MAQTFNLGNALQAGDRAKANVQNQELNALRIDNAQQQGVRDQQVFDQGQQRSNTEKLLTGIGIVRSNPNMAEKVLGELASSQIIQPDAVVQGIQLSQSDPQAFESLLNDMESQLRFALGDAAPGREDRKILQGADKLNRFVDTGEQVFSGVEAPAGGMFGGDPAAVQLFNTLSEAAGEVGLDGKPTKRAKQAQTQLGTRARVGSSSLERIAGDSNLANDVADSQAQIEGAKEFAKKTGAARVQSIDSGFEKIQSIDSNIRNIDKAISALQGGAKTGPVVSRFFPSIRSSSVKLDQIRNELGLDVVGGVTFGALSKGELDLALNVALPTNLNEQELSQWLQDKKSAQEKLREYFVKQIDFFDQGGTKAQFLRQQERGGQGSDKVLQQARDAITQGADRNAVIQRLNDQGVDASAL